MTLTILFFFPLLLFLSFSLSHYFFLPHSIFLILIFSYPSQYKQQYIIIVIWCALTSSRLLNLTPGLAMRTYCAGASHILYVYYDLVCIYTFRYCPKRANWPCVSDCEGPRNGETAQESGSRRNRSSTLNFLRMPCTCLIYRTTIYLNLGCYISKPACASLVIRFIRNMGIWRRYRVYFRCKVGEGFPANYSILCTNNYVDNI